MSGPRRDRAASIALSVLAHLALVGLFAFSWWRLRPPKPPEQALAIEATVISSAPPAATQPQPDPQPEPQPVAPPQPDPDVAAQRQLEEQHAAEQREAEQKAADQKAADQKAAEKKAADQKLEEARSAATAKAAAEKEKQAREAAALKQQQFEAAQRKLEDDKRKQDEARQLAEKQRAEHDKAQRETELRNQMAAEEHLNAVRASGLQAQYLALIRAKVQGAWIRPPSARPGLDCVVRVTQVPGGTVTDVQLGSCNGDDAVRQSIEAAVLKASPLPAPPDPSLFDRNLTFNFRPND